MSAWLTSDDHISAMVQHGVVSGMILPDEADEYWQRAKWQNQYALHCRYGDDLDHDDHTDIPLNRRTIEAPLDRAVILKQIQCWFYQCAEFEGFDQTKVSLKFTDITDVIAAELDAEGADPDSFFNAPWGIESIEEAIDHSRMGQTQETP